MEYKAVNVVCTILPSKKMPDSVDRTKKIWLPSMKMTVFVDGSRLFCYICAM